MKAEILSQGKKWNFLSVLCIHEILTVQHYPVQYRAKCQSQTSYICDIWLYTLQDRWWKVNEKLDFMCIECSDVVHSNTILPYSVIISESTLLRKLSWLLAQHVINQYCISAYDVSQSSHDWNGYIDSNITYIFWHKLTSDAPTQNNSINIQMTVRYSSCLLARKKIRIFNSE